MEIDGFENVSEVLRSGVYVLCWKGKVMYVGKSKHMIARVYTHRNLWRRSRKDAFMADYLPIKGVLFDEVLVRFCPVHELDALEKKMIIELKPTQNVQLVPRKPLTKKITITVLGTDLVLNDKPKVNPSFEMVRRI